jgi:CRISPR-associated protein Cas2
MKLAPPPDPRALWIVAYDIVDDRRRARIARLLLQQARRLQKSVFEAILTLPELRALAADLAEIAHPAEDRLDFLPLCAACARRRRHHGRAAPDPTGPLIL